jgi:hypothetical protein
MNTITNKTTVAYCDLESPFIAREKSILRHKVTRPVCKSSLLPYPYPAHYGIDRKAWLCVVAYEGQTTYHLTLCHECLMWRHIRVIELSLSECLQWLHILTGTLGKGEQSVFEPTEHDPSLTIHTEWTLESLYCIG